MKPILPPPILVAAADHIGAIGQKGALPWHIPAELHHFRRRTAGHALIMGRATFDSLPRPLNTHGRVLIVVSSKPLPPPPGRDLHLAPDPKTALAIAHQLRPDLPPLICGGARIYHNLFNHCAALEISRIDQKTKDADAFLPELGPAWKITEIGPWQDGPPRWRIERWTR